VVDGQDDVAQLLRFVGLLAGAVGREDPAALHWLAAEPGRGLVVTLGRMVVLRRPDQVGGCRQCGGSTHRPCLTWDRLADALLLPANPKVASDFRDLLRRYGGEETRAPT